jgi:hypothetical protein
VKQKVIYFSLFWLQHKRYEELHTPIIGDLNFLEGFLVGFGSKAGSSALLSLQFRLGQKSRSDEMSSAPTSGFEWWYRTEQRQQQELQSWSTAN